VKTANGAMAEILEDKHSNLFEIIHLIYSVARNITEDINEMGSYQSGSQSPKTPPWVIDGIERALTDMSEIEGDGNKNIKKESDSLGNIKWIRRKM
jgi:hypothetical protein